MNHGFDFPIGPFEDYEDNPILFPSVCLAIYDRKIGLC